MTESGPERRESPQDGLTDEQKEELDGKIVETDDALYQFAEGVFGFGLMDLGDRRIAPEYVPDIGDGCLNPHCDGEVVDVNGKRWCSEHCLEWFRTTPQAGDPCDRWGDRCDGTLQPAGELAWSCDTCARYHSSARVEWREAWMHGGRPSAE